MWLRPDLIPRKNNAGKMYAKMMEYFSWMVLRLPKPSVGGSQWVYVEYLNGAEYLSNTFRGMPLSPMEKTKECLESM
jgi:hypothetical protein